MRLFVALASGYTRSVFDGQVVDSGSTVRAPIAVEIEALRRCFLLTEVGTFEVLIFGIYEKTCGEHEVIIKRDKG